MMYAKIPPLCLGHNVLTDLPLVLHIYASMNWVSIGSDNGLSPIQRQVII